VPLSAVVHDLQATVLVAQDIGIGHTVRRPGRSRRGKGRSVEISYTFTVLHY
jgi:hypothetical protein